MIASTCQAPGSTGPHRAVVSAGGWKAGRTPIMGIDSQGVLDASVEETQKPADEEVGGGIIWALLGEVRGARRADWGRRGFGQTHPWACLVLMKEISIMGMCRTDASSQITIHINIRDLKYSLCVSTELCIYLCLASGKGGFPSNQGVSDGSMLF